MSVLLAERSFTNEQIRRATSPLDLGVTTVQFNALKLVVPHAPSEIKLMTPDEYGYPDDGYGETALYDDLRIQTEHNNRKQSRVDDHNVQNGSLLDRQLQLGRSSDGCGPKPPRNTLVDVPGFRGTLSSTVAVTDTQQDEVFGRRFQLSDMQGVSPEF